MKATNMKEDKLVDPRLGKSTITKTGQEDHSESGGPLAAALRIEQRDNLGERVRALIKSEKLAQEAIESGYETFEESDDFTVEDDDTFDPQTPYEEIFEGSVVDDAVQRYQQQREQLKNASREQVKAMVEAMDPKTLAEVMASIKPPPEPEVKE